MRAPVQHFAMARSTWDNALAGLSGEAKARHSLELSAPCTVGAFLERAGLLSRRRLRLCLCGADEVRETSRPDRTLQYFLPLARLCAEAGVEHLELVCVGPGLRCVDGATHERACDGDGKPLGCQVALRYHSRLFDEALAAEVGPVDATACLNAGVWGFDSWPPTLALLAAQGPVLITAYNDLEADDDLDTLRAMRPPLRWLWEPEPNPCSSLHERAGIPGGRRLRDNDTWQCIVAAGAVP